jgi:hypothetical protein
MSADHGINDAVDAGYRRKYRRYGERLVGSMVSARAIRLVPRSTAREDDGGKGPPRSGGLVEQLLTGAGALRAASDVQYSSVAAL